MYRHITNLLKGEVTGRVESAFPERVLNICAEYGIRFWNLQWECATAFTFTTARRDWKRLRRLSRRLDCDLTATGWRGTPFFLGRMRHRYGLWITLSISTLLLFYGSFFIWDFSVEGNETVREQEILRALESCGVTFGTFGYGVNSFDLRNELLLKLPKLSYIAINVRGCRAYVQVRERIEPPEIVSRRLVGNTVASKDALVTAIQPWDGEKQVLPGTTVKTGQLLISGVTESDYGGTRFLRGMGSVTGRTWYTLQCKVPLTVSQKEYTGKISTLRALLIGKKRINLYISSSISGDTCDKITIQKKCTLPGNIPLPVTMVTQTLRFYHTADAVRSEKEALKLADQVLTERLTSYLAGGEVIHRALSSEIVDDTLLVTLTAECEEEIGTFVHLPKEQSD
ncbi:MAG: sporulation protein YqfD [Oscillospiraceae bacterium]|nr:sporulation protein YqfD [Oscillospiraceae bacterium]